MKIIEKIAALLRLAENAGTAAEAENAAAHAARLMAQYRVDAAEVGASGVEPEEPIHCATEALYEEDARATTWLGVLALGIAKSQSCEVWYSRRGWRRVLRIAGRASDIAAVRYLYAYLSCEIDRLARGAQRSGAIAPGKTAANNFRHGAVSEVIARLKSETQAVYTAAGSTALATVDDHRAAVRVWTQKFTGSSLRAKSSSRSNVDYHAREAGREAGRAIPINRGLNEARGVRALGGKS